jgi:hypothetical protein
MTDAFADRFRIEPGTRVHLERYDPADMSAFPDRSVAEAQSAKNGTIINELQDRLYAEGRRALLVVLQGTDTAGKDGTILHVFRETGPRGVTVTAFRRPSEEELAHDMLYAVGAVACDTSRSQMGAQCRSGRDRSRNTRGDESEVPEARLELERFQGPVKDHLTQVSVATKFSAINRHSTSKCAATSPVLLAPIATGDYP